MIRTEAHHSCESGGPWLPESRSRFPAFTGIRSLDTVAPAGGSIAPSPVAMATSLSEPSAMLFVHSKWRRNVRLLGRERCPLECGHTRPPWMGGVEQCSHRRAQGKRRHVAALQNVQFQDSRFRGNDDKSQVGRRLGPIPVSHAGTHTKNSSLTAPDETSGSTGSSSKNSGRHRRTAARARQTNRAGAHPAVCHTTSR